MSVIYCYLETLRIPGMEAIPRMWTGRDCITKFTEHVKLINSVLLLNLNNKIMLFIWIDSIQADSFTPWLIKTPINRKVYLLGKWNKLG